MRKPSVFPYKEPPVALYGIYSLSSANFYAPWLELSQSAPNIFQVQPMKPRRALTAMNVFLDWGFIDPSQLFTSIKDWSQGRLLKSLKFCIFVIFWVFMERIWLIQSFQKIFLKDDFRRNQLEKFKFLWTFLGRLPEYHTNTITIGAPIGDPYRVEFPTAVESKFKFY